MRAQILRTWLESFCTDCVIESSTWGDETIVTWILPWDKHSGKARLRIEYDGHEFRVEREDPETGVWRKVDE